MIHYARFIQHVNFLVWEKEESRSMFWNCSFSSQVTTKWSNIRTYKLYSHMSLRLIIC